MQDLTKLALKWILNISEKNQIIITIHHWISYIFEKKKNEKNLHANNEKFECIYIDKSYLYINNLIIIFKSIL